MSGKKCNKCDQPFKGFGTTCSACRKGASGHGKPCTCDQCGVCFMGAGTKCPDCKNGKGTGRMGVRGVTPEEVDACLDRIDRCIIKVDASKESMVKLRKAELDLLGQLEIVRDLVQRIVKSGDRLLLQKTFVDCGRVARLNAFLSQIHLSPMNAKDQRLKTCEETVFSLRVMLEMDMGIDTEELTQAAEDAQGDLLKKRLSVLMDQEKLAEVEHEAIVTTGDYQNVYEAPVSHTEPGDIFTWEVEDYSDWEDEDLEEMTQEKADELFDSNVTTLFNELDVNNDGTLTKQEVLNGASSMSGLLKECRIHKRKHVIKMFKEGDIDQNGTLDLDEFKAYIKAARQKSLDAQPKHIDDEHCKKIFALMDTDGDGSLTEDELKKAYAGVLLTAGENVDEKRVSKWVSRNFKRYDADGSGTLDFKEFKKLLQRSGALAPVLDLGSV